MGKRDVDYEWLCSSGSHVTTCYALAAWPPLPWHTEGTELPPAPSWLVGSWHNWEGGSDWTSFEEEWTQWEKQIGNHINTLSSSKAWSFVEKCLCCTAHKLLIHWPCSHHSYWLGKKQARPPPPCICFLFAQVWLLIHSDCSGFADECLWKCYLLYVWTALKFSPLSPITIGAWSQWQQSKQADKSFPVSRHVRYHIPGRVCRLE